MRNERQVSCTMNGSNIPYPLRPPTLKDRGPRGAQSFGLAFVFNELLWRRCTSPTTQGVALLFVSADRFVGKGTAHARFATFRGIATYGRGTSRSWDPFNTRGYTAGSSFLVAVSERAPYYNAVLQCCTRIDIFLLWNEVFWSSKEFIKDLPLNIFMRFA